MQNEIQQRLIAITAYIRSIRLMQGLTQSDMADRLNMTQNGYSKIESGKTRLSLIILFQIADIFKIDIKQLLKSSH